MGRYAALAAGLPLEVPGYTLDRRCGSGLQALADAAMHVQTGHAQAVLVVGVESMSNIEYYSTDMRWGARAGSVKFHDRLERGRERSQPHERFRLHLRHARDRREPGPRLRHQPRGSRPLRRAQPPQCRRRVA
ncbi:hypothetical protein N5938_25375 [Pseudomonas aeruginosa]|uniref:thiolase family protein n=1 Tax=Pseudomonas aeruginosa TaxID=287 RepID=UPI0021F1D383|nr:beta-ketoacyl synthase N-terminal-like domain-containing protein [Pseudomonas aeruginosa]UYM59830.1 hypothetical protein N5938_25375 [Pseudomonas aeruginosa]